MPDADTPDYTIVPDVRKKGQELLQNEHEGIQSMVLHEAGDNKTHLFAIPEGEMFPTHDAPHHVMIHVVEGRARVVLGDDKTKATPNTWISMRPNLPHSLEAITPFVFTLHLETIDAQ